MNSQEQLLLDTGRVPLFIRVPVLIGGVFFLWLAAHIVAKRFFGYELGLHSTTESGSPLIGFIVLITLGLFFLSVWFLRNRFLFDADHNDVVIQHRSLFGRSERRIPLIGARCVYVDFGRLLANTFWDIGIEFENSRREWLIRVYGGADKAARIFSDATRLPVVRL